MTTGDGWDFSVAGAQKLVFDWKVTQRTAAAEIIPIVLARLREKAPVGDPNTHPDSGRFRDSIGFRIESTTESLIIKFVSTAPYAKYVLQPTEGGQIITPQKTIRLRYSTGTGSYIFASQVTRGATPGNDFNIKVAAEMEPIIRAAFKTALVSLFR
jgi:hypothetical protein